MRGSTIRLLAMGCLASGLAGCSLPRTWEKLRSGGLGAVFEPSGVQESSSLPAGQQSAQPVPQLAQAEGREVSEAADFAKAAEKPIPVATPFPDREGYVYSPHTNPKRLVSVRGFSAGEQVLCPYTLEAFTVPEFAKGPALITPPPPPKDRLTASSSEERPREASGPEPLNLVSAGGVELPLVHEALPEGTWVVGRPGFVRSPFAASHQLVDVTGMAPGTEVRCPYSAKPFRVPSAPADAPAPAEVAAEGSSPTATKAAAVEPLSLPTLPPAPALVSLETADGTTGAPESPETSGSGEQQVPVAGETLLPSLVPEPVVPFVGPPEPPHLRPQASGRPAAE